MNGTKGIALGVLLAASMPCMAYTGNDLQEWAQDLEAARKTQSITWKGSMLVGYVAGVAETIKGVIICPKGMQTHLQNAAIVSKYLEQNPERWSENGATLVTAALRAAYPACEKR